MNNMELADRIIDLGVGHQGKYPLSCDGVGYYHTPDGEGLCAELFVTDWRVAGALMEKCLRENIVAVSPSPEDMLESLPRAIAEGCVEALS